MLHEKKLVYSFETRIFSKFSNVIYKLWKVYEYTPNEITLTFHAVNLESQLTDSEDFIDSLALVME